VKAVILAGGKGTRLGERTNVVPKPLVEVAGQPIILHIMDHLSAFGINDFLILGGYRSSVIKNYFLNLSANTNDIHIDMEAKSIEVVGSQSKRNWRITILNTGLETMTGGRLLRASKYLDNEERFLLTYGDGIANVDIHKLLTFHSTQGTIATLTAVNPPPRFGNLEIRDNLVSEFHEKSIRERNLINGGFCILEKEIFNYLRDDNTVFEEDALRKLSQENQLSAFVHNGFWQCIDTERDLEQVDKLLTEKKLNE
jgi:glucose-1-phosphate cytidylyltransferase